MTKFQNIFFFFKFNLHLFFFFLVVPENWRSESNKNKSVSTYEQLITILLFFFSFYLCHYYLKLVIRGFKRMLPAVVTCVKFDNDTSTQVTTVSRVN